MPAQHDARAAGQQVEALVRVARAIPRRRAAAARAAASSIASGMPSRRRQILDHRGRFAARQREMRIDGLRARHEQLDRARVRPQSGVAAVRHRERAQPVHVLVGGLERFLARHQHAHAAARRRVSVVDERRHRVGQMLAVVEHQQQRVAAASCDRSASAADDRRASCAPIACATAAGTSAPSVSGASSTHHTPSGIVGRVAARSRAASATACATRVLPMPPAPTIVTTGVLAQQRRIAATIVGAPVERGRRDGRFVRAHRRPAASATAREARRRRRRRGVAPARPADRSGSRARESSRARSRPGACAGSRPAPAGCSPRPRAPARRSTRSSFLVTSVPGRSDQRHQQVEGAGAQGDRLAVGQQHTFARSQLEAAEAARRRVGCQVRRRLPMSAESPGASKV